MVQSVFGRVPKEVERPRGGKDGTPTTAGSSTDSPGRGSLESAVSPGGESTGAGENGAGGEKGGETSAASESGDAEGSQRGRRSLDDEVGSVGSKDDGGGVRPSSGGVKGSPSVESL